MDKQNDPLFDLWHSQPTQKLDPEELKSHWNKNQAKQRWWLFYDVLGFLMATGFCSYVIITDDNLFKQVWASLFLGLVVVVTPLIIKLRYKSLQPNVPTSEYLQRIIQQKMNNIRMSELSLYTSMFVSIAYGVWSNGYFFYYDPEPYVYLLKVLRISVFILVMNFVMALWARYYIGKNNQELERFSKVS